MMELITKRKDLRALARYHDSDYIVLRAGFDFLKCNRPDRDFSKEPDMQKYLQKVYENSDIKGSDNVFICRTDIKCHGFKDLTGTYRNAAYVAATIVCGKPTKGENLWMVDDGSNITLKELFEKNEPINDSGCRWTPEQEQEMLNFAGKKLRSYIEDLQLVLSYAGELHIQLGGDNQYRFEVPHHLDVSMEQFFGLTCVEVADYDLLMTWDNPMKPTIEISSKMGIGLIHTENGSFHKQKGSSLYKTKSIIMSSTHIGSETRKPVFDLLLIAQHSPFLALGLAPYSVLKMKSKDAGWMSEGVDLEKIQWVIWPHYKTEPIPLQSDEIELIAKEVEERKRPTLFKRLKQLRKS